MRASSSSRPTTPCCASRRLATSAGTTASIRQKPPVIVIDPRAGHGPGIGGFKRDSEVGIALHVGHPVYFVIFFPEPCPGQTLADVLAALRRFVEHVAKLHEGRPPILYGNCQAGWAATLVSAHCEDLAGPVVLNGSPLSYWAGEPGVNPMRITAGLVGGVWLTHFLADLSQDRFDGAWLAQGFEKLSSPAMRFGTSTPTCSRRSTPSSSDSWTSSAGGMVSIA